MYGIHVLIAKSISDNLINYDRRELLKRYPHLHALILAPQCVGKSYRLDVLIGADAYWDIMEDEVIRGPGDGPKP